MSDLNKQDGKWEKEKEESPIQRGLKKSFTQQVFEKIVAEV